MRIVLTGGPGAGKTSITKELIKMGHNIIEEPARRILQNYEANSPYLLPSLSKENRRLFQIAVENQNIEDYFKHDHGFFDRSILDEVGYRNRFGVPISRELDDFIKQNRYDAVFFFPFWKEIYKNDDIRKESPKEAELVSKHILKSYLHYGYDPIIVPKVSLEDRLKYIITNCKKNKAL